MNDSNRCFTAYVPGVGDVRMPVGCRQARSGYAYKGDFIYLRSKRGGKFVLYLGAPYFVRAFLAVAKPIKRNNLA